MSQLLVLIFAILSSSLATARSGEILYQGNINDIELVGAVADQENSLQVTKRWETHRIFVLGTDDFSTLNQRTTERIYEKLIDVEKGNEQWMLENDVQDSQKLVVHRDIDIIREGSIHFKSKFTSHAVITKGNWQKYLSGEEIELQITSDGELESQKAIVESTAQFLMDSLRRQLSNNEQISFVSVLAPISHGEVSACRLSKKTGFKCHLATVKFTIKIRVSPNQLLQIIGL